MILPAAHTMATKFYRRPFFFWSLIIHLLILTAIVIFLKGQPTSPKPAPLATIQVELAPAGDRNQRAPNQQDKGKTQQAKPKPANKTGESLVDNTTKSNRTSNHATAMSKTAPTSAPQPKQKDNGKADKVAERRSHLLKNIDPLKGQAINGGRATSSKGEKAEDSISNIKNEQIKTGAQDSLIPDDFLRLRQQLAGCWQIPAGVRDIEHMKVTVLLTLARDGTVENIELKNKDITATPSGQVMVDSALRSFNIAACQKLSLPTDKYPLWRHIEFTFDPQQAL